KNHSQYVGEVAGARPLFQPGSEECACARLDGSSRVPENAGGHLFTNSCALRGNGGGLAAYLAVSGRATTIANRGLRPKLPSNPATLLTKRNPPCPAAKSAAFRCAPPLSARWPLPPSPSRRCGRPKTP